MKQIMLGKTGEPMSAVVIGCMRLNRLSDREADAFVRNALDGGANYFDHADIYGGGECEERFGRLLHADPGLRERIVLQSKCGIRTGMYDFSREHILASVDGSLRRLHTDRLDVLLLHRPDILMEPEEVAEAFDDLYRAGKVRRFGVSNQNPAQMRLLQSCLRQDLVANQLQLSPTNCGMFRLGVNVNMENEAGIDRDGSVLEYCRLHEITMQAWSPFQYGFFDGVYLGSEKYPALNAALQEVGARHGLTPAGAVTAWILRHPAGMQMITGATNSIHLQEILAGAEETISREEWYEIYRAAGNKLP